MWSSGCSLFDSDLTVGHLQQGAVRAPRVPDRLDLARLRRAAAGLDLLGLGLGLAAGLDLLGLGLGLAAGLDLLGLGVGGGWGGGSGGCSGAWG